MARFELPTLDHLRELGEPREHAITIYARTSPSPDEREGSRLNAKSAFDSAIRTLRDKGLRHNEEEVLREQWEKVVGDDAWGHLSRSLAIFLEPDHVEVFALPNQLENQLQVGRYFDLGQIARAVSTPQTAYALTLSANGWNLWEATATTIATEIELREDHGPDASESAKPASRRTNGFSSRLEGDEGKKVLLEQYAHRVAEAVRSELGHLDPHGTRPLFVFAADPLLDLYRNLESTRRVVAVHGNPDDLRADQVDSTIREHMPAINAEINTALVDRIADGVARGTVATDVADIAKAATLGAVATFVYDFTVDILGRIDSQTGDLTYTDDGYDLLSKIVITVLTNGGEVIPVRADEITHTLWNRTAIASLRHPLT